jgi:chaperonin GroEL
LPLLEHLVQSGKKDLAIIADDIIGEALTTIVLNRMKGVLNIVAVKAPGFGDKKKEYLQDLAILTGATLITKDLGFKLENAHPEYLGSASNFIAGQSKTRIIGGRGDKSRISARIDELKRLANKTESEFEREKLAERIAKLGS